MENYEKCWPHCCMHLGDEKITVLLKDLQKQKEYRREGQVQIVLKLITLEERV